MVLVIGGVNQAPSRNLIAALNAFLAFSIFLKAFSAELADEALVLIATFPIMRQIGD